MTTIPNQTSFPVIELQEIDSTNLYLSQLCNESTHNVAEFTTVYSHFQTAGKGQRGNHWESEKDKNLLFSFVLYPLFLEAKQQFILSQIISLSIKEVLDKWTNHITIKWPNDIYYRDRKICGILIENDLKGCYIGQSICGIGLNINQKQFYSDAPNPVSLKQITGQDHNCQEILNLILQRIHDYYYRLSTADFNVFSKDIQNRYHCALFRKNGFHAYEDQEGIFKAQLVGVENDGRFLLQDEQGQKRSYLFKEVQYIL